MRRELFGGIAGATGLGAQLRIKQFSCDVVGVLAPKGQGGMGDQDDAVLLPLHTLQRRVTCNRKVNFLMVSMAEGSDSAPLRASPRQLLRERRKLGDLGPGGQDDNFNIFDTPQLAATRSSTMGVLTSLLGAVAAGAGFFSGQRQGLWLLTGAARGADGPDQGFAACARRRRLRSSRTTTRHR